MWTSLGGGYFSACIISHFSCVWLFVILWTRALQAPLSMGFFRREYWSGLPCRPPEDLPYPGVKPVSLTSPVLALAGRFFTKQCAKFKPGLGDAKHLPSPRRLWKREFFIWKGTDFLIADVGFYLENITCPKVNKTVHESSSLQETTLSKKHLSL